MADSPDFSFEEAAFARGLIVVAGVDEVGRGPLCGPVTAAAVILDPACIPEGLNDSKKLSAKRRADLAARIMDCAEFCVAHASVEEIDELNIYHASHLAMCRAVTGLARIADHVLVDGNRVPSDLQLSCEPIVKGDARCLSIAAASILAKEARDLLMVDLAQQYPGYGWERNAGYATKDHLQALLDLGVTPVHRRSFKPVHNILCQANYISP
ncbi:MULTISPECIES: ribonuclease HII [Thioclava]|uniref:ribonuclease HII n=1 Tax=Thioclava TaxID=285107 RepID=UPI000B54701B|nr:MULTISPECIES: ribonuclease HII [Thioclava]OWY02221.1 ribonuclease HII [Thioclava sp. IC9]OWY13137.1 ribonuclease HII [Thioclava sp. F34-6]PWE50171.1 ribonuclease HII [Thioclava sp. NG1]WGT52074.1 ribonuclease HII [Thioclava nitratireducens]